VFEMDLDGVLRDEQHVDETNVKHDRSLSVHDR
jgi:hypothetical protein